MAFGVPKSSSAVFRLITQPSWSSCHLLQGRPAASHIILLTISDNGPGIPEESRKEVFRRFYRIDSSRKDKQHFGLGLSIAREIVSLHGGTITVSETPGGGATFTMLLPEQSSNSKNY